MKKILYIKPANSSFILNDQKILEKHFDVRSYLISPKKSGLQILTGLFKLIVFILGNAGNTKVILTWFGDYHAAVIVCCGRLLHIKVVIFAGGQEAIFYPELKKGVYYKKYRGMFVKYALRNADLIIPNHQSLVYHENFYYDPKGKKDGIKYYIPDLKTRIAVLPNGIDTTKFFRDASIKKNPGQVLTVGTMHSIYDFINKGFDLFIRVAERNPDLEFVLIGIRKEFLPWVEENYHVSRIRNLELIFSFCPDDVLFKQYNTAKVFVQASITEGMPNTISEAMLCECIPVGSNVNGIPDAMGGTGIIIQTREVGEVGKAIHLALAMNSGALARSFVTKYFSLENREKALTIILSELC